MPKPKLKIYLDTSVPNGCFDDHLPERQRITKDFFKRLDQYKIYISDLVKQEID